MEPIKTAQTQFQKRVARFILDNVGPLSTVDCWQIAQGAFPEKWKNRASRGALVGHIDRVATALGFIRLAPGNRFASAEFGMPHAMSHKK